MQISRMFPEQLSWRHAVNMPLLPADVEQHSCPRVTLNRSFRWSLLYYTTDVLGTLFPRMCESCRGGVSFISKAGSKQCISKENTVQGAALCSFRGCLRGCAAQSREQEPALLPLAKPVCSMALSQPAAFPWKGVDLPWLIHQKGNAFWFQQTQVSFGIGGTQV